MRPRTLLALAALAACTLAAPAAGTTAPVTLTVAHATFPERALILALPRTAPLTPADVRLSENGQPVTGPVQVTGRDSKAIGFVLAIDQSASMRGAPLADARKAATAFAERRQTSQRLGVVTFNSATSTLLAPTTEAKAISRALSAPAKVAVGTRLWDAVSSSIGLLQSSGVQAGSVVVLSDGRDTNSTATVQQVIDRARAAQVRVFTVGLRSPQFDPATLRTVATATGGTYAETTSSGLVGVYTALAARLANEYVVEYQSSAPRGTTVHVTVVVPAFGRAAGTATVTYAAPLPPGGGVLHRSDWDRFLTSRASVAAVALAAALLAALAVRLAGTAVRRRPLAKRLDPYVEPRVEATAAEQTDDDDALERSLAHLRGWDTFVDDLEVGQVRTPAKRLVLYAALAAAGVVLVAAASGLPWLALLAIVPFVVMRSHARRRANQTRQRFEEQLPDTLRVLASALRAGYGMTGALHVAIEDADEPMRSELDRALAEEQLGVPLDEGFVLIAERMHSSDLEHVAFVTGVHRQTGGNTAEVLDRVHDVIRERFELRRIVRALTAQARMARWILSLLPVVLAAFIGILNPGYLKPLYDTTAGRALIALAVAMVVTGFFLIKRLTEIKV